MSIVETVKGFVIARGKNLDSFFAFFVDGDGSSWTRYPHSARSFSTRTLAETDLLQLRVRATLKRKTRTVQS